MKIACILLYLLFLFSAHSQSEWEIELSHEIPVPRMGKWVKGDYTVYISLDTLSLHFRRCEHSITRSLEYYKDQDSNLANYFRATQNRYGRAAKQLEEAANGFNLKNLIIYEGVENSNRNLEDFAILESYLKQRVEQRKALVFYKGQRIYKLCRISEMNNGGKLESVSDILNHGYEIRTFYDQPENCIFHEYVHLGW